MIINKYNVAIVGVTGLVGNKIFNYLLKRKFPINKLKLFASHKSVGKRLTYKNTDFFVEEATENSFKHIDLVFFSAGAEISKLLVPRAVEEGAIVIDNTSAYRMDEKVPLVVPEVNPQALKRNEGIIANPNCSTIQLVVALAPIQKMFGIDRVLVSTYQSISGAGNTAIQLFKNQILKSLENKLETKNHENMNHPFAFNLIPQIDQFEENGYTKEEMKMINETKKILEDKTMSIAATCIRVPVFTSHSESVYVEIKKEGITQEEFIKSLAQQSSIKVLDNPRKKIYPTPLIASNKEKVFVGRIRKDLNRDNAFHLWVVSDNLLKGAALNSIQIAEALIEENLI